MTPGAFGRALGGVFENSPWVAEAALASRPFADLAALHQAMVEAVLTAPAARQIELLQAHPELAGHLARAGAMTAASVAEQSGAGLDRLDADELRRFDRLNERYRAKFGFPFIVAVRGHTKRSILAAFEARLANDAESEREAGLGEVFKIARLRLEQLVEPG